MEKEAMNEMTAEGKKPSRRKKTAAELPADRVPFEEAVARLETIVSLLEGQGETASLDGSLRLYEEGIALVRRCTGELDAAEQRVKILQRTEDGEIAPQDFTSTPD